MKKQLNNFENLISKGDDLEFEDITPEMFSFLNDLIEKFPKRKDFLL